MIEAPVTSGTLKKTTTEQKLRILHVHREYLKMEEQKSKDAGLWIPDNQLNNRKKKEGVKIWGECGARIYQESKKQLQNDNEHIHHTMHEMRPLQLQDDGRRTSQNRTLQETTQRRERRLS